LKVVALAGGTGSAKLLRGLSRLPVDLTVVANVGDNAWFYGVYVCPDVDISCYTLAAIADGARGWGIEGDTFDTMGRLSVLGVETWFRLGDRDLATCLARTQLLRNGHDLTSATDMIRRRLGAKSPVLPACDEPVRTMVSTPKGELDIQEFWVRDHGRPAATGVSYWGAERAHPTEEVSRALKSADLLVVCPANPVSSIGPMLAVPGFTRLLSAPKRRVALSPMAGGAPFSGPAGKLMRATGARVDSLGVAKIYSSFLDEIVISAVDERLRGLIEEEGVRCRLTDTLMRTPADELRLAKEVLEA
jgi:LPPG:FO 2-phospho-L-lactate transferase